MEKVNNILSNYQNKLKCMDYVCKIFHKTFSLIQYNFKIGIRYLWITVGEIIARNNKYEEYEPATSEMLRSILEKGDFFIDIGANIGHFTKLASEIVGENGKVYSFEPTPDTFTVLQKETLNKKNITLFNYALGASEESKTFFTDGISGGNSLIPAKSLKTKHKLNTITLDSLFQKPYPTLKLVKIDVEGYEKEVIKGGSNLIKNQKPKIIFEVQMDILYRKNCKYNEVFDELNSLGYNSFTELETGRKINRFDEMSHFQRNILAEVK